MSTGWPGPGSIRLLARHQAEGEAAFEPRSRRPKTSPNAISGETVELIVRLRKELAEQGLDAGPDTIAWHLEHHHQVTVSAGDRRPVPGRPRPGHSRAPQAAEVVIHKIPG